ncbi:hypothetical protein F5141DRAFT_482348 [Pisolithus sp. B1]|nr:hypothetical protein F5141DRAFT_482348 [Pisolithus sp. B1]
MSQCRCPGFLMVEPLSAAPQAVTFESGRLPLESSYNHWNTRVRHLSIEVAHPLTVCCRMYRTSYHSSKMAQDAYIRIWRNKIDAPSMLWRATKLYLWLGSLMCRDVTCSVLTMQVRVASVVAIILYAFSFAYILHNVQASFHLQLFFFIS